jgi:H+/Cl- antiporter ClcA
MTEEMKSKTVRPPKYWLYILVGTAVGVLAGYAYFYFIGCRSGACALRANPYYNMLLGGLLGYIVTDWIVTAAFKRKKSDKTQL